MKCSECKMWVHKICIHLSPTPYKRCSKLNSHWFCTFYCSNKTLLIRKAHSLPALACNKIDCACTVNTSTDRKQYVIVVPAVVGHAKHPSVNHGKVKPLSKLPKSEILLDVNGHDSKVEIKDPDRTSPFLVVSMWLSRVTVNGRPCGNKEASKKSHSVFF